MATVKVEAIGDGAASLSVQSECDSETLTRFLDKVSDLLKALLEAEVALDNLADELPENRTRAMLAIGMKVSYHLDQAGRLLRHQVAVANGEEAASQHGFPEFDDDVPAEIFQ